MNDEKESILKSVLDQMKIDRKNIFSHSINKKGDLTFVTAGGAKVTIVSGQKKMPELSKSQIDGIVTKKFQSVLKSRKEPI